MTAQQLLESAKPQEALEALQEEIRQQPGNASLRIDLFQLLAVSGQWDRAIAQVQTAVSLDRRFAPLAVLLRSLVELEQVRAAVFSGRREPQVFGPTPAWMKTLLANRWTATATSFKAVAKAYDEALKEAPARSGKVDGRSFGWLADADARFGPSIELYLQGNYYWVPLECVDRLQFDTPRDLQDLVWLRVKVTWTNGGTVLGHVPARYPGTERSSNPQLALARSAEWEEIGSSALIGTGVRVFSTDDGDFLVTKIREINFSKGKQA
ncbi:MAG: type VI secretion system accessory protein TagJ [Nibricoccus sp.]